MGTTASQGCVSWAMRREATARCDLRALHGAVVLKGQRTVGLLSEPLQQETSRLAADGGIDWRNAEAALFCIRCVHD